jgi:hypothetical protein
MNQSEDDDQETVWELLYNDIGELLERFGREDPFGDGDYWIVEDNIGTRQHKIVVQNLDLLEPSVVAALRRLLVAYPGWEIVVAVDDPKQRSSWPDMGLIVRAREIVDGLQRRYLPERYRALRYEDSRPGTEDD